MKTKKQTYEGSYQTKQTEFFQGMQKFQVISNFIYFKGKQMLKTNPHNKYSYNQPQKMDGEQLPKATMIAFVKKQTNNIFSPDYISKILHLARQFVVRVADKSNVICQSQQKKTINVGHLEAVLKELGVTKNLGDLKQIEGNIKQQHQLKRQANQRLQEILAKDLQEQRERRKLEAEKKDFTVRQKFAQIEKSEKKKEEDYDYENLALQETHSNQSG